MTKNNIKPAILCFLIAVICVANIPVYAANSSQTSGTQADSITSTQPGLPEEHQGEPSSGTQPATEPIPKPVPIPEPVIFSSDRITSTFLKDASISTTGMSLVNYKKTWDFSSVTPVVTAQKYVKLDLSRRYRYSELESIWKSIADNGLYKMEIIGKSVDNRNIYALKLGSGKKSVLITAGVHARETSNTLFITRFLIELSNSYKSNLNYAGVSAKTLLDRDLTIYVIPCVNPDGYEMTQFPSSIKANLPAKGIKNLSAAKSNANLVDLNRNFPNYSSAILWKNIGRTRYYAIKPGIQFYPGKALGDQPETQAVMRFVQKYLTKDTKLFIDIHSGGSIVYGGKPHLSDTFNTLCQKFRNVYIKSSGYKAALDELTGQDSDGTVTDYVTEYVNNYTFNAPLGRLIPTGGVSKLVRKSNEKRKYPAAVMSIETLPNGLSGPASTTVQSKEWTRGNIPKSLMKVLVYNP
jgi:predicted deacylase